MNQQQAKFILSSFRPDGADAGSPEFADALRLAVEDRALGEWLAAERALDAEFARALSEVMLPETLKEAVLDCLAAEGGREPERDEIDGAFAEALAGVRPPPTLRDEILVAMRESAPRRLGWRFAIPLAAAAGIMLAVAVTRPDAAPERVRPVADVVPDLRGAVPVSHVEAAAIKTLTSPDFSLDLENPDHEALFRFIRASGRPCPAGCLPPGLRDVPGIGCRELVVDGKPGAMICFLRGKDDAVHLVIFRKDDVECDGDGSRRLEQHGDWAVARWTEKGRVLLLIGQTDTVRLGELF